jgi:hypothetical protein
MEMLFMKGELDAALQATVQKLLADVQSWDPDQLLTQSENEVAAYLAEQHTVHCPELKRDAMYADEPADVNQIVRDFDRDIQVPVTRLRVHVPYEGERIFFDLRPSTFTYNPPRADVTDTEVVLTFEDRQLDGDRVRGQLDHELAEVERWLEWSRAMADRHNASLLGTALSAIRQRKEKLLRDRQTVAGLGIPVRRSGNAPSYAVPVTRRRPNITKPPARTSGAYEPEPTLSDSDYEEAIRIISNSCRQLERSPSTTLRLDEEERRDLLLVALNSQFEGQAGGEVFNGAGKTDILLRVDNRNVFIAECKIWRGPKAFARAIDQLLGYLVWRDTKAAIVLFIETRNPSDVIRKASSALSDHPQCVRTAANPRPEDRLDFVLLAEADPAREIRVALLPVVIGGAAI